LTFESPSKLNKLEPEALSGCDSLKSLSLPASLSIVDGASFIGSSIENISVDAENPLFFGSGDCLVGFKGPTLIRHFRPTENMVIGREYNALGTNSFTHQQSVVTVAFEEDSQLALILAGAFSHCSSLKSISIPASVKRIAHACFDGCSSLSEVTFESGSELVKVGRYLFRQCLSLISICIPAMVERLPECFFIGCKSLTSVTFEPNSKLRAFRAGVFDGCDSFSSICIPSSVEYPGFEAFRGCVSLSQLTFELPSRLKQLSLPPSDFGVVRIPDSVIAIWAVCPRLESRNRVLQLGGKSCLKGISVSMIGHVQKAEKAMWGNGIFVRYPDVMLRRYRREVEGSWTEVDIGSMLHYIPID
jgi:hypothetical protein